MKRPLLPASLRFALCSLALVAALFPLTQLLHKPSARMNQQQDWFEEAFLFV